MKACLKCGELKPLTDFNVHTRARDGRKTRCRVCTSSENLEYYRKNAEAMRRYRVAYEASGSRKDRAIRRLYGLSLDDYNRLLAKQGGGCGICGKMGRLCVDHDHATKEVRGLLCHSCNLALGKLGDTPEAIENALRYLQP